VQVKIDGCENAYGGGYPTGGVYDVYDGACEEGDQEGRPVYYNYVSRLFLFFYPAWNHWVSSVVCGSVDDDNRYANGVAGDFPFVSTANTWRCSDAAYAGINEFVWDAVTVMCSMYSGDQAPCRSGTYSASGMGEAGHCTKCPPGLESSPPASTSAELCFTVTTNVLVSNGYEMLAYNGNDNGFHSVIEDISSVYVDSTAHFISDSEFLTLGYLNGDHTRDEEILIVDLLNGLQRVFASPTVTVVAMVFLPLLNQIAVMTDPTLNVIVFFNVGDFKGTPFTEADAIGGLAGAVQVGDWDFTTSMFVTEVATPRVITMSVGESGDELLLVISQPSSLYGGYLSVGGVLRFCVPNTACRNDKNGMLVPNTHGLNDIGAMRARGSYLVLMKHDYSGTSPVAERVYECAFEATVTSLESDCSVFAYRPEFKMSKPEQVFVNDEKELVYVYEPSAILVFDFDGNFFGRFGDWSGGINGIDEIEAITFVPGPFGPLSPVQPPPTATAGVPITAPLTLRTSANKNVPADYPAANHISRYEMTATSEVSFDFGDGTTQSMNITLPGELLFSPDASPHASLTSIITLNIPGVWTISITESIFAVKHNVLHSPFTIMVDPAPLDSFMTRSTFSKVVTAGSNFKGSILPFDEFNNPTFFPDDSLRFSTFLDDEPAPTFIFSPVPSDGSFALTAPITTAGSHTFRVEYDGQELDSSPFYFEVKPGAPSAPSSKHNIVDDDLNKESRNFHTVSLKLRVTPYDEYENLLTSANGYYVSIGDEDPILLRPPLFSRTHIIPKGFTGDLKVSFTLNGKEIANSPVTLTVQPDRTNIIAGIVVAALVLASVAFYSVYTRQMNTLFAHDQEHAQEMLLADRSKKNLELRNENLRQSLREKKHSEDELAVMKQALVGLEKKQKDELEEVLIESCEFKVDRLLGKGGFGVVNLATYRGQKTAMKQLLTINDESVKRFR